MTDHSAPREMPALAPRAALRARLLAERAALPAATRAVWDAQIIARLEAQLAAQPAGCVGAYWPMRAEPDLRPLLRAWHARGLEVALPRVVARGAPLRFARWTPETVLEEHRYGALLPDNAPEVQPELLIIPCVGFDARRYRLGYGGGYYDRTLAAGGLRAWGVAYECSRIAALDAADHDLPLDAILTEAAVW